MSATEQVNNPPEESEEVRKHKAYVKEMSELSPPSVNALKDGLTAVVLKYVKETSRGETDFHAVCNALDLGVRHAATFNPSNVYGRMKTEQFRTECPDHKKRAAYRADKWKKYKQENPDYIKELDEWDRKNPATGSVHRSVRRRGGSKADGDESDDDVSDFEEPEDNPPPQTIQNACDAANECMQHLMAILRNYNICFGVDGVIQLLVNHREADLIRGAIVGVSTKELSDTLGEFKRTPREDAADLLRSLQGRSAAKNQTTTGMKIAAARAPTATENGTEALPDVPEIAFIAESFRHPQRTAAVENALKRSKRKAPKGGSTSESQPDQEDTTELTSAYRIPRSVGRRMCPLLFRELFVIGSGQTIVMANGLQWNKVPEECATKGYHLIGLPACAVYPLDGKVPGTWNKEECELAISALLHPEPTQRCTIICTASATEEEQQYLISRRKGADGILVGRNYANLAVRRKETLCGHCGRCTPFLPTSAPQLDVYREETENASATSEGPPDVSEGQGDLTENTPQTVFERPEGILHVQFDLTGSSDGGGIQSEAEDGHAGGSSQHGSSLDDGLDHTSKPHTPHAEIDRASGTGMTPPGSFLGSYSTPPNFANDVIPDSTAPLSNSFNLSATSWMMPQHSDLEAPFAALAVGLGNSATAPGVAENQRAAAPAPPQGLADLIQYDSDYSPSPGSSVFNTNQNYFTPSRSKAAPLIITPVARPNFTARNEQLSLFGMSPAPVNLGVGHPSKRSLGASGQEEGRATKKPKDSHTAIDEHPKEAAIQRQADEDGRRAADEAEEKRRAEKDAETKRLAALEAKRQAEAKARYRAAEAERKEREKLELRRQTVLQQLAGLLLNAQVAVDNGLADLITMDQQRIQLRAKLEDQRNGGDVGGAEDTRRELVARCRDLQMRRNMDQGLPVLEELLLKVIDAEKKLEPHQRI